MHIAVTSMRALSILTRCSGYLASVASHSLQPYAGCTFGRSLCGIGCYAQHNHHITRGRPWGSFLVAKSNAAELYLAHRAREQRWANRRQRRFTVFMSSVTDPFVPHEHGLRVTRSVLNAMLEAPPEGLILQTHTHLVIDEVERITALAARCDLRVHLSIESDRDRLPGLPPPPSAVRQRLRAAGTLRARGIRTVVTVAPLLPIEHPVAFFERLEEVADAVVLDHFVGGDGTASGWRTRRTALPAAMERLSPGSADLAYLDRMVALARTILPGRVGVGIDGFAGRLLEG